MKKSKVNNSNTRNPSRVPTASSIFLVLILTIASISGIACAMDVNEDAYQDAYKESLIKYFSEQGSGLIDPDINITPSNYPYGYFDNVTIVHTSDNDVLLFSSGTPTQILEIPERYDLREQGRTPSIKNQYPFNTCWAFAGLGSVKSNLLTKDKVNYTGLDLSEYHLAYFANHIDRTKSIPELSGISNDTSYMKPQEKYMDNGANFLIPMMTLMSWIGPIDENAAIYPKDNKSLIELDERLAYSADEVHVQNVTLIEPANMDGIKATLMKQGAAALSVYINFSKDEKTGDEYYFKRLGGGNEYSYNYPDDAVINHAVMVIGWDDNFKKENFSIQPTHDGAWLIQNSYGDEIYQYLWISYNDSSISRVNSGAYFRFYDADPVSKYDNNYQYDGAVGLGCYVVSGENNVSTATFANVFTAKSKEYLKAVSVATLQNDIHYSIQVYHNLGDDEIIGDKLLSTPVEGFIQYIGYHTIPLPEELILCKDGGEDKFSVVVNLTTYNDNELMISYENYTNRDTVYSEPYIEEGQSYMLDPKEGWVDLYDLIEEDDEWYYGNFRIKAYTVNVDPKQSQKFAGGDGTLESPYEIATPEQLDLVRTELGKHYKLVSDIDLSKYAEGNGWCPIGTEGLSQFYGSLEGAGYTISNLTIYRPDENGIGLFGRTINAKIINLTLENVNITGNNGVGGLIGHNIASASGPKAKGLELGNSIIRSCHVSGTVVGQVDSVGGLVGMTEASGSWSESLEEATAAISESSFDGYVVGSSIVGGLVGQNVATNMGSSVITDSYATGNVVGKNVVGGLVGYHYSNVSQSHIQNCYATGGVKGDDYVGGLVGSSDDGLMGSSVKEGIGTFVINCTALNPFVFGVDANVSRVIGNEDGGVSANNYALSSMVCSNTLGEVATGTEGEDVQRSSTIYGEDVTPETAKSKEFYSNTLGWNFEDAWNMDVMGKYPYPFLQSSSNVPVFVTEITELPLPTASGRYVLGADIEMDSTWIVTDGVIVLDLNGHNITMTNDDMSVISVTNNAVLFITDSSEDAAGQIMHSKSDDVSISDEVFGGGVYIDNGIFIQSDGIITKNAAKHGGGVCVANGIFLLAGGTISENVAKEVGGGVMVFEDKDVSENEAIFIQIGGDISSNTALTESGGGVAVTGATFVLSGGNITNNYANATGGGLFVPPKDVSGDIIVSGGCVEDNFAGEKRASSNVYLSAERVFIIPNRGLENGTSIGVSTEVEPTKEEAVAITGENDDDYSGYFFSDNALYHIENGENNVSCLVKTLPVSPNLPVSGISVDLDGNVTIEVFDGATVDESLKNVTIEDPNSRVALIITFDTPQSPYGTIFTGKATQAVVEYPKSATVPNSTISRTGDISYEMSIELSKVTNFLPEIDATINETVRGLVESDELGLGLEMATMITAVGENVSRINAGNITENGISIIFTVPAEWYDSMKGGVFMFHVKDGEFVDGKSPEVVEGEKDGDVYIIQITGSTFSSYGIAGKPEVSPDPTPTPSGGSGHSGSSTWATVTPTPTQTATPTLTPTPTGEPTGVPTATSSTPTKTPVPVVGLILGGVSLALVLRRK